LDAKKIGEYFPSAHVIQEVLRIYESLLGLTFHTVATDDKWHPDVQVFCVNDTKTNRFLGTFYLDLFPRPGKFGHACVVNLINTHYRYYRDGGSGKMDYSAMLCNLSEQMSHGDVVTFFHEFGHVMHNICGTIGSKSPYAKVPRDFVEAPSQMLENWCWQRSLIKRLSKHVRTGESMPDDMIGKLQASRFWMGLFNLRRQLSLNKFDQELHGENIPRTLEELAKKEQEWTLRIAFDETEGKFSGLARNFGHTVSLYSASYYGYLWSEVFSADMFQTCFTSEETLTDPKIGLKYRQCVLLPGGTKTPDEMLQNFLGRAPEMDAFLRQYKI